MRGHKTEAQRLSGTRCVICDFRMSTRRFCNRRDSFPMCDVCTEMDFGEVLFDLDTAYRDDDIYPNDKAVTVIAYMRAEIDRTGGVHI